MLLCNKGRHRSEYLFLLKVCLQAFIRRYRTGDIPCSFLYLIVPLQKELENEAQAEVVVAVVWRVVVPIRYTTVPGVVVPAAATVHAIRALWIYSLHLTCLVNKIRSFSLVGEREKALGPISIFFLCYHISHKVILQFPHLRPKPFLTSSIQSEA